AATRAISEVLRQVRSAGTPLPVLSEILGFQDFLQMIGLPEIRELEQRFGTANPRTSSKRS
ncbi:MAG: hypothetical protein ACRERD_04385, partial [Candidatus Binatia bacterium]